MDTSSSVLNYNLWFSDSDLSSISSSEAFSPSLDSSVSPSYRQLPQSSSKPEKRGRTRILHHGSAGAAGPETRACTPAQVYSGSCSFGVDQYSRQYYDAPQGDGSLDAVLQSPPTTQTYCQMSGKEFCMPLVPREYWG
ncbi:hypothetical protein KUCAC02_013275 [Chaenocephalus aceratus]|nr:hypothetical protein KUCAC02_013275 [Chaenocephalus aceratus]